MPRVTRPEDQRPPRVVAARSPRSVSDRPSRWRLLLRRQRRMVRPALLLLGGAGCVAALVMVMRPGPTAGTHRMGAVTGSPGSILTWRERLGAWAPMRVRDVEVLGRANTPEAALQASIGVLPGQPILAFSVEDARQRIEALPWIAHATVERRLPGTIVVQIEERRPFAIWQNQGKFMLIDRAGQVVADQDVAQFHDLPLVVGPGAPDQAAGLLDALVSVPAVQSRVTAAVRVGERRWNLLLTNGMQVMLPEGAAPAALTRLMELQTAHAVLDRPLEVVDMRLPDRLVLRPRPATGDATPGGLPTPPLAPVAKKPT